MSERGFTMPTYGSATGETVPEINPLVTMFSSGVLSEAQQYGYDLPPKYVGGEKPPPAEGNLNQSQAYIDALIGAEQDRPPLPPIDTGEGNSAIGPGYAPDSCVARACAALAIDDPRRVNIGYGSGLVSSLIADARARALADPRAVTVTQAWSTCMAGKGFQATIPIDFANLYSPGSKTYNGANKSAEIAAATADVQCKYETNYFGVMYSLVVKYQQAAIESHAMELDALSKENSTVLAKANDVIAHG